MNAGSRIQECFKENSEDNTGTWYGGIVGDCMPDGKYVMGFDDGELRFEDAAEVKGLWEMGKLTRCAVNGGLVADTAKSLRAVNLCPMKCGNETVPIGVLLSDDQPAQKVAGLEVYHSHMLSVATVEVALQMKRAGRPARGAAAKCTEDVDRAGYCTLQRGNMLLYIGEYGGKSLEEVAFGVLVFQMNGQQNRFVITYDEAMQEFSVSTWTSWRRTPASPGDPKFDPDASYNIKMASARVVEQMMEAWRTDTVVRLVSSPAKLKK